MIHQRQPPQPKRRPSDPDDQRSPFRSYVKVD
nr:MAG TPA: hypothetical protein [Caudoviricetes sp.]